MRLLAAAKPMPWWPAADGPQATVGPQVGFHVKEEVSIGFEFDRAVARVMIVARKITVGRNDGKCILISWWVKEPKEM